MLTGLEKNNIISPEIFFYIRQRLSKFYPFTPLLPEVYPQTPGLTTGCFSSLTKRNLINSELIDISNQKSDYSFLIMHTCEQPVSNFPQIGDMARGSLTFVIGRHN